MKKPRIVYPKKPKAYKKSFAERLDSPWIALAAVAGLFALSYCSYPKYTKLSDLIDSQHTRLEEQQIAAMRELYGSE